MAVTRNSILKVNISIERQFIYFFSKKVNKQTKKKKKQINKQKTNKQTTTTTAKTQIMKRKQCTFIPVCKEHPKKGS